MKKIVGQLAGALLALVVTTGTFLNGLVHIGPEQHPAGRAGEPPSRELAESLKSFGFEWGRLKTGTPPRLDRASIDFDRQVEDGRFTLEKIYCVGNCAVAPSVMIDEDVHGRVAPGDVAELLKGYK